MTIPSRRHDSPSALGLATRTAVCALLQTRADYAAERVLADVRTMDPPPPDARFARGQRVRVALELLGVSHRPGIA